MTVKHIISLSRRAKAALQYVRARDLRAIEAISIVSRVFIMTLSRVFRGCDVQMFPHMHLSVTTCICLRMRDFLLLLRLRPWRFFMFMRRRVGFVMI